MYEHVYEQTTLKKAAIVVLISLAQEAENKSSQEIEAEIRNAVEEGLTRIPWVALEKVIIVKG